MYKFSAETTGFYLTGFHTDIPADAVDITEDKWRELMIGQEEGKIIAADDTGYPVLLDRPAPTHEQYVAAAEQEKQNRIDEALQSISVISLKLRAGRALTDAEQLRLDSTLDYIDAVTATDTDTAPDINWPEKTQQQ
ncbi:tail fiber assembly protein [Atlantibacter hermannii]|uniref:tail fiber assembly protein n=1 Tax=Atlantibacter hermannii TaxID=565 RepID=UPI003250D061